MKKPLLLYLTKNPSQFKTRKPKKKKSKKKTCEAILRKKNFKKWKAEIFFPSEKYFVVVLRLKKTQKTNASLLKSTNTPTTIWYITSALLSTWVWGFAVLPDDFPPKSSSLKCCLIIWKIDNLSFQSLIPLKEKAVMLPWINQKNLSGNTASLQSFWCLSTIEKNVHRELCELF